MRAFILLLALATLTAAQYNYNRASAPSQPQQQQYYTGFIPSGSAIASPSIQQQAPQPAPAPAPQQIEEVNKEFYTYTAPEEEFAIPQQEQQLQSVTRKNLQVVFIHAPEQPGLHRAVQSLAQQTLEQQTAIYVLTKQPDLSQLSHSLQRESNHVAHKPEVHFIKYRTPEDAQRAQQSIRAQYDALGGSSSHNDEGVAPVLNFASQQPQQQQQQQSHQSHHQQAAPAAPSQTYLPSFIRL